MDNLDVIRGLREKPVYGFHFERSSEQIPLSVIDALGFKPHPLPLCLNAFGHNFESECFSQLDQSVDNRCGLSAVTGPNDGCIPLEVGFASRCCFHRYRRECGSRRYCR
jgi:hypothetical protein